MLGGGKSTERVRDNAPMTPGLMMIGSRTSSHRPVNLSLEKPLFTKNMDA
jgi:hypothetical protein